MKKSDGTHAGRIYVDATKYDRWVYIDFHTGKVDSCLVADSLHRPANWDIALHRYDVKTHGGSVLKTQYSELSDLTSTGTMPAGNFANDVWSTHKVMIDVSHMMQGHVVFESTCSARLGDGRYQHNAPNLHLFRQGLHCPYG